MEWHDNEVATLRELWNRRDEHGKHALSTSAIGREFGRIHHCAPISKNAVVGKAHRLGLLERESPILRVSSGPRPQVAKERKMPVEHGGVLKTLQPLKSVGPSPFPPVRREPRTEHTCSWPIGHPGTKGFCFCSSVAIFGKPYCIEHASHAYLKTG